MDIKLAESSAPVAGFGSFEDASRSLLAYLQQKVGLDLWMVTRTVDPYWTILEVAGSKFGIEAGAVLSWSDSICSRMIAGLGPNIVPCLEDVRQYMEAAVALTHGLGAYVGVPITYSDGSLFGTLCGISTQKMDEAILQYRDEIHLMARLLSTVLAFELERDCLERSIDAFEDDLRSKRRNGALGVGDFFGALRREGERGRRLFTPVLVGVIDLVLEPGKTPSSDYDVVTHKLSFSIRTNRLARGTIGKLSQGEYGFFVCELFGNSAIQYLAMLENMLGDLGVKATVRSEQMPAGSDLPRYFEEFLGRGI
ncbi:hypothetical protein [Acidithrix ferrooxidans]|uniref:GAF domain protein n=2 Tax=root TaxID=1 RepID=A0A0D8HIG7_9ACTN|nr:hypothetical protein [Acidithrix ferrooxidans]KJF17723.1 hypothetical protein AXFE_14310 [Acidithrix ferrooxidans]